MTRLAEDGETLVRFLFQSGHFNTQIVRKNGIQVRPNPESGRYELSAYLLSALPSNKEEYSSELWLEMPRLGQREGQEAKGFATIPASTVRALPPLDVEVNNIPNEGHCDVINWSEDDEERMEQQIDLGKLMTPTKRPSA